ncbi:hypothetical protein G7Y89_g15675 [Cudoniella acicularis]|uniref:Uncharacterized protein n=1 Tax=Cudoniella acicularis TaxID=354080 RepID=A0A8H4VIT9_9HELO|nr:hypothetical protein G7Y89_g15675 [Cudoniella acicularis]
MTPYKPTLVEVVESLDAANPGLYLTYTPPNTPSLGPFVLPQPGLEIDEVNSLKLHTPSRSPQRETAESLPSPPKVSPWTGLSYLVEEPTDMEGNILPQNPTNPTTHSSSTIWHGDTLLEPDYTAFNELARDTALCRNEVHYLEQQLRQPEQGRTVTEQVCLQLRLEIEYLEAVRGIEREHLEGWIREAENRAEGGSQEKAEAAIESMKATFPNSKGEAIYLHLNLDDLTTIKASVNDFLSKEDKLNVLWNNAGVLGPA